MSRIIYRSCVDPSRCSCRTWFFGRDRTQVVDEASWAPREYHDVAVFDNRMWVLEGAGPGNRNDVWSSSDGVTWYEVQGTPWPGRHAASVYVYDGGLWMVAGNLWNDVWKLVTTGAGP